MWRLFLFFRNIPVFGLHFSKFLFAVLIMPFFAPKKKKAFKNRLSEMFCLIDVLGDLLTMQIYYCICLAH